MLINESVHAGIVSVLSGDIKPRSQTNELKSKYGSKT